MRKLNKCVILHDNKPAAQIKHLPTCITSPNSCSTMHSRAAAVLGFCITGFLLVWFSMVALFKYTYERITQTLNLVNLENGDSPPVANPLWASRGVTGK